MPETRCSGYNRNIFATQFAKERSVQLGRPIALSLLRKRFRQRWHSYYGRTSDEISSCISKPFDGDLTVLYVTEIL